MATNPDQPPSALLQYLPAIFEDDDFIGQFLSAFETILMGVAASYLTYPQPDNKQLLPRAADETADASVRGLADVISVIADYFDPHRTPGELLQWLSGWVALTLRADLDDLRRRDFIANAASLYRLRGTKQGLTEAVRLYTRLGPTIDEQFSAFQIGVSSRVGVDTRLSSGAPYFFRVRILLPTADTNELKKQTRVVRDILDMEKPAHTHYVLEVKVPSMQIGVQSRIGVNTLLGTSTR